MTKKKLLETYSTEDLFTLADNQDFESEKLAVEPYSYWKTVFRIFIKKKSAFIALIVLGIMLIFTILIPLLNPLIAIVNDSTMYQVDSPYMKFFSTSQYINPINNQKFEAFHLLGTNNIGVDLWVAIWQGVSRSLSIALVVALINVVMGILIGSIWGFFRKIDRFMIELLNFINNIPGLLFYMLMLYILNALGSKNQYFNLILCLTLTGWTGLARLIRNQILIISNREYNVASKTLGTSPMRIIIYNLLPFILPVIITSISLEIPATISLETSLTFFGFGFPPTTITLATLVNAGYSELARHNYVLFVPAIALGIITVSFYLIGLSLADALDPKEHR